MGTEYIKDFDEWNKSSKFLDTKEIEVFSHERQIWWCALGVNIGSEQDGKGEHFKRPVVILRNLRRDLVLIAPITSKINSHSDRVMISLLGKECQILLSQIRVISTKRLLRREGRIRKIIFQEAIIKVAKLVLAIQEGENPP